MLSLSQKNILVFRLASWFIVYLIKMQGVLPVICIYVEFKLDKPEKQASLN